MHTQTHAHSPMGHVQSFSNYQLHTDAGMNTNTCFCSAGHESMAHCDSCRCGNGNFNEVSAAVVVSSPFLVWENGTLSRLPKNGPAISLEIEAETPVSLSPNNPSSPGVHTHHFKGEVNKHSLTSFIPAQLLTTSLLLFLFFWLFLFTLLCEEVLNWIAFCVSFQK